MSAASLRGSLRQLQSEWSGDGDRRRSSPSPVALLDRYPSLLRNCWRALVGTTLAFFVLSIPARHRELEALAQAAERNHPGLLKGFVATISAPEVFPTVVLALEIMFVLGLALASAGIASGRRNDWRNMFFSAVFVTYSVWVTPTLDALQGGVLGPITSLVQAIGLIFAIHFFLLFPDGRFVPRWTRVSSAFWVLYTLAWGVNPDASYSLIDPFDVPFLVFAALMTGWITGLIAQLVRYRSITTTPEQCRQTRWVILAIAGAVAGYGTVYLPGMFIADAGASRLVYDLWHVPVFWVLAMPISFALCISMMRYQLFDFQAIVKKTLVYACLSTILGVTYVGMVALLGQVLHSFTGGSNLAIAGSTLTVSALFRPARARIQEEIDRRFYRKRYDAAQALESFTNRLREEIDLASLEKELLALVAKTMQPTHASLWLVRPR